MQPAADAESSPVVVVEGPEEEGDDLTDRLEELTRKITEFSASKGSTGGKGGPGAELVASGSRVGGGGGGGGAEWIRMVAMEKRMEKHEARVQLNEEISRLNKKQLSDYQQAEDKR